MRPGPGLNALKIAIEQIRKPIALTTSSINRRSASVEPARP